METVNKGFRKRLLLRIILTLFVVGILIARFLRGDFNTVFFCILTLLLFEIPAFVNYKLNIKLPDALEIVILLFIFSAEILGELGNFYNNISWWDTMLHTINGFLMAAIGFALIDILNNHPKFHISLSPIFVAFVAFCFSMTVGVVWEFFEFGMDMIFKTDMQKDMLAASLSSVTLNPSGLNDPIRLSGITETTITYTENGQILHYTIPHGYLDIGLRDTMEDLIVNCIGAIVFSLIGYFYIIGRNSGVFARKFIPQMKTKDEIKADNRKLARFKFALRNRWKKK